MIRIAIVEDEYPIQVGLKKLIEQLSLEYRVVGVAANTHDGLTLVKEQQPDLVFCDIKLGKQNGLEMIGTLVDLGIDCKYVILSGYSEFSFAQQAIKLGVIDYLVKPTNIKQISQLLKTFAAQLETSAAGTESEAREDTAAYSPVIAFSVNRIHSAYSSAISLSSIAEETGVTSQYLSALFTKEVGVSFVNYLRNFRIQKAQQLLCTSSKKISDVAFSVGYDDPQYFCRVFKSVTDCSPKHYRYANHEDGVSVSE